MHDSLNARQRRVFQAIREHLRSRHGGSPGAPGRARMLTPHLIRPNPTPLTPSADDQEKLKKTCHDS